jgi:hypothetical protein|tara:strand:+ start:376 stop:600 length:225 start_codon:yes stop_codon:yes gene_type:complete
MHSETVDWPEMANFIAENQTEDRHWTRTEVHVKYYDEPISRNVGSMGTSLVDIGDYMLNLLHDGNVETVTLKKL